MQYEKKTQNTQTKTQMNLRTVKTLGVITEPKTAHLSVHKLQYTIQHRTALIISPVYPQTEPIAEM